MVRYLLPSVGGVLKLERRCPHCGRCNGRIHSAVRHRPIRDLRVGAVAQRRMYCPWCRRSWTLRAAGVGPGYHRSNRTIGLGVLLYMLGLSYRHTEEVLSALGCRSGKSSVERTWEQVSDDPVDPTNNATERLIGLTFKIRAKTAGSSRWRRS